LFRVGKSRDWVPSIFSQPIFHGAEHLSARPLLCFRWDISLADAHETQPAKIILNSMIRAPSSRMVTTWFCSQRLEALSEIVSMPWFSRLAMLFVLLYYFV
jgi:hypothetical protein